MYVITSLNNARVVPPSVVVQTCIKASYLNKKVRHNRKKITPDASRTFVAAFPLLFTRTKRHVPRQRKSLASVDQGSSRGFASGALGWQAEWPQSYTNEFRRPPCDLERVSGASNIKTSLLVRSHTGLSYLRPNLSLW